MFGYLRQASESMQDMAELVTRDLNEDGPVDRTMAEVRATAAEVRAAAVAHTQAAIAVREAATSVALALSVTAALVALVYLARGVKNRWN